jgi:hypothetical protein
MTRFVVLDILQAINLIAAAQRLVPTPIGVRLAALGPGGPGPDVRHGEVVPLT